MSCRLSGCMTKSQRTVYVSSYAQVARCIIVQCGRSGKFCRIVHGRKVHLLVYPPPVSDSTLPEIDDPCLACEQFSKHAAENRGGLNRGDIKELPEFPAHIQVAVTTLWQLSIVNAIVRWNKPWHVRIKRSLQQPVLHIH